MFLTLLWALLQGPFPTQLPSCPPYFQQELQGCFITSKCLTSCLGWTLRYISYLPWCLFSSSS